MATPEALFLARLHGQDPQEPGRVSRDELLTSETDEKILRFLLGDERTDRALDTEARAEFVKDSLNQVLDSIIAAPEVDAEEEYFNRLAQYHQLDPRSFPAPRDIEFVETRFGRLPRLRGTNQEPDPRRMQTVDWFQLWPAVKADVESQNRVDQRRIREELSRVGLEAGKSHLQEFAGRIFEAAFDPDFSDPAREFIGEKAGDAASALGSLVRAAGSRVAEGASAAGEVLGQGATDLEFLLREFVLNEIIGDGGGDFPSGNPRAVEAERFAEGPRDRLMARLLGPR